MQHRQIDGNCSMLVNMIVYKTHVLHNCMYMWYVVYVQRCYPCDDSDDDVGRGVDLNI